MRHLLPNLKGEDLRESHVHSSYIIKSQNQDNKKILKNEIEERSEPSEVNHCNMEVFSEYSMSEALIH